jgi:hypothetical protein
MATAIAASSAPEYFLGDPSTVCSAICFLLSLWLTVPQSNPEVWSIKLTYEYSPQSDSMKRKMRTGVSSGQSAGRAQRPGAAHRVLETGVSTGYGRCHRGEICAALHAAFRRNERWPSERAREAGEPAALRSNPPLAYNLPPSCQKILAFQLLHKPLLST